MQGCSWEHHATRNIHVKTCAAAYLHQQQRTGLNAKGSVFGSKSLRTLIPDLAVTCSIIMLMLAALVLRRS